MNGLRIALLFVPLLAAAQQPVLQPPAVEPAPAKAVEKCSLEGQVANSLTGEPLRKAHLALQSMRGPNSSAYGAVSDAGGHFVIENIEPGQYQLSATRNGFTASGSGARGQVNDVRILELTSGQHVRDLNFRLVPHGVIAGRVLDEEGEPVEGAHVAVMRYAYQRGKRQFMPASAA